MGGLRKAQANIFFINIYSIIHCVFCNNHSCIRNSSMESKAEKQKGSKMLQPEPIFTKRTKGPKGSSTNPHVALSTTEQPLFKSFLPYLKQHLRLCNIVYTVPFEWDNEKGMLSLLKSKVKNSICGAQMVVHICYTLGMCGYFVTPQSLNTINQSKKMIALAFLVCFVATTSMRIVFWNQRPEVVFLVNSFLDFENKYLPTRQKGKVKDQISKALLFLGVATSLGLPGLMFCILVVDPCKPPHLGYILFQNGLQQCLIPSFPVRLALLIFDAWMWFNSIAPACFFGFPIFYLGMRSLTFYLNLLIRGSQKEFSKKFRNEEEKSETCFKFYRHLQLLTKLFNVCLQTVFVPTQIYAACLVIIIGLYTCIKLHRVVPMPGFAFFPLLSLDGFAIIFISQIGSGIYLLSRRFVMNARKNRKYRRLSWSNKVAKSCEYIKIQFGATAFLDQMTPLVLINFCLTQTVSLILLS